MSLNSSRTAKAEDVFKDSCSLLWEKTSPHIVQKNCEEDEEVKMFRDQSSAPLLAELLVVATQNLRNHISGYRCAVLNIVHP